MIVATVVTMVVSAVQPTASAASFTDGFETGDLRSWSGVKAFTVQQSHVASGSWGGRATSRGSPSWVWRSLGDLHGSISLRAKHAVLSRSGAVWLQYVRTSTGGGLVAVGLDAGGRLILRNIVTGAVLSSPVVFGSGFHALETRVEAGTQGSVEVWFDGVLVPQLTREQNLGTSLIARIMVGDVSTGRSFDVAVDDVEAVPMPILDDGSLPACPMGSWPRPGGRLR
jgi:hypothetical protein